MKGAIQIRIIPPVEEKIPKKKKPAPRPDASGPQVPMRIRSPKRTREEEGEKKTRGVATKEKSSTDERRKQPTEKTAKSLEEQQNNAGKRNGARNNKTTKSRPETCHAKSERSRPNR